MAYRDVKGNAQEVNVSTPVATATVVAKLQERRKAHKSIATSLAKRLKQVKDTVDTKMRMLPRGNIDRTRLAQAMAGANDVYTATVEMPATSFVASIAVDLSGSMGGHMRSNALYDATMVLGDTFDLMDMPFEVRGFSDTTLQYKALDDTQFDPARAACLSTGPGQGTALAVTAGLTTTSLGGRPEKNKLFISLTDGAADDHDEAAALLAKARQAGILTFGVFLGTGANTERMDDLYGKGNWTSIQTLSQMPLMVGSRIERILKSIR